jgi:hypothetical protein
MTNDSFINDSFIIWASEMDMRLDALRKRTESLREQLQTIERLAEDLIASTVQSSSSTNGESESPSEFPRPDRADASALETEASPLVVFANSEPGEANNE